MVLTPGGPTTHGKWFFTSVAPVSTRHTFGSLNYYKGNTEAVFSGVGEVARGHWRDGSTVLCSGPPPAPSCFHSVIANFDIVEVSTDAGVTWHLLGGTPGNDSWGGNVTVTGTPWHFQTTCGTPIVGAMGLDLSDTGGVHHVHYPSVSLVLTYPPTWRVDTVAGSPPGWGGGYLLFRIRCSSGGIGLQFQGGSRLSSLSASIASGILPGDTFYTAYFQNGNDLSGGTFPTPAISLGWTLVHSNAAKRSYLWRAAPSGPGVSVSVSGVANADLQSLYMFGVRSIPGGGIVASNFKDAQTAATALTSGNVTFTGGPAALEALFVQTRDAGTFQAAPTFTSPLNSFAVGHSDIRQATGGTPVFETKADIILSRGPVAAGTYSTGITSSRSLGWDSMFIAVQ